MHVSYNDKTDLLYIRLDDRKQEVINRRVSDLIVASTIYFWKSCLKQQGCLSLFEISIGYSYEFFKLTEC